MDALRTLEEWPAEHAAAGVVHRGEVIAVHGPRDRVFRFASVTKPVTALAALVAIEEGIVALDDPAGPPGSTLRHLLAHASGLPPDGGAPIAPPAHRRIYSNSGFDTAADTISAAAEMPFAEYLRVAVLGPLELGAVLTGSPASGLDGTLEDLLALAQELQEPTLIARETLDEATAVAFPGLPGVLPGFGRQEPNDWGLGFELRDAKSPHWTGARNSPRTFGHFGQTGTFVWVDPDANAALAVLTDLDFGEWARAAWPRLADEVLSSLP